LLVQLDLLELQEAVVLMVLTAKMVLPAKMEQAEVVVLMVLMVLTVKMGQAAHLV